MIGSCTVVKEASGGAVMGLVLGGECGDRRDEASGGVKCGGRWLEEAIGRGVPESRQWGLTLTS